MEASLRQSTKYQQFQMPVNWDTFVQPSPLPSTHSLASSVHAAPVRPELGLTKADLLLQETNTCPCEQVMWWICDTLWNRETTVNSMVLQDIAKNCHKTEWLEFLFSHEQDWPLMWIALIFLNYTYYFSSLWSETIFKIINIYYCPHTDYMQTFSTQHGWTDRLKTISRF